MTTASPPHATPAEEPIPWQQRLLDNIFLVTAVGLIFPTLFYVAWGLFSLLSVPAFTR